MSESSFRARGQTEFRMDSQQSEQVALSFSAESFRGLGETQLGGGCEPETVLPATAHMFPKVSRQSELAGRVQRTLSQPNPLATAP